MAPPAKYLRWFDTAAVMGPVTEGNVTEFFTSGEAFFDDLADRLEYDAAPGAVAYLLGWSCDINVALRVQPTPAGLTLGDLLAHFARQGGAVFAMLWDNTLMPGAGCAGAVAFINALPGGLSHAILDHRTPLAGTHHQKVQMVVPAPANAKEVPAAIAYCGGMDIFADRIGPDGLHDVHAKVRGPGADALVQVFQERWNDHPDHTVACTARTSTASFGGTSLVQVCRTYPAFQSSLTYSFGVSRYLDPVIAALKGTSIPTVGDMRVNGSVKYYSFSPVSAGVQQVWRAVRQVITQASRFIYIEDQYFTNKWIGDALAAKLVATTDVNFRIVIVLLHPDRADIEQMWPRRRDLFAGLIAADPQRKRWTVVTRRLDRPHAYVHSKTWIVDDEVVITGSANGDRRGYTYNSEADVVIAGDVVPLSNPIPGATTVAQDLRARLCAAHLGGGPVEYLVPGTALKKFFVNLGKSNVERFDPAAKIGAPDKYVTQLRASTAPVVQGALNILRGRPEDWLWNYVEDPDRDVHLP